MREKGKLGQKLSLRTPLSTQILKKSQKSNIYAGKHSFNFQPQKRCKNQIKYQKR
jgi:hypothetical protein